MPGFPLNLGSRLAFLPATPLCIFRFARARLSSPVTFAPLPHHRSSRRFHHRPSFGTIAITNIHNKAPPRNPHHHHHDRRQRGGRSLATSPRIVPDGVLHDLKGDVTPKTETATTTPFSERDLPLDADGRILLKGLSLPELQWWVQYKLDEKPFRARQLWRWLYRPERLAATFDEMSDLSKSFRAKLAEVARIDALTPHTVHEAEDGTKKLTYRLTDGPGVIESVLIPTDGRTTLCVSSQWGCALNCQFCLTGRTGFKRSLSQAEIVDQVVLAKRFFESSSGNGDGSGDSGNTGQRTSTLSGHDSNFNSVSDTKMRRSEQGNTNNYSTNNNSNTINNVVFMGEGEPAHNLDNVMRAVDTMLNNEGLNLSHNKITVSTSGLVPEIRRFAKECRANLAVSLHATNDELRSWLMPINRKYPLPDLMSALRDVFPRNTAKQQKVFFQYVMLAGVNDSLQDAKDLLRITAGVPCKINLIHFNQHDGSIFQPSDDDTIAAFQNFLVKKGMVVTVRKSRGDEKMMACGQLGKIGEVIAPRLRVPEKYAHAVVVNSTDNDKDARQRQTVGSDITV